MRCPHCGEHVLERWQPLVSLTDEQGQRRKEPKSDLYEGVEEGGEDAMNIISAAWMECPNSLCGGVIVAVTSKFHDPEDERSNDSDGIVSEESWITYPRRSGGRPVEAVVPKKMAEDYLEAAAILRDSPKASAAIARRILADILKEFGGYEQFQLSKQIGAFADDPRHPSTLRENAKYLVQLGDFAAHTQKDELTQTIVDVEPEEAEWTLDVIDGMFDYFIVGPARDRARRAAVDEKLRKTGRRPIEPSAS